VPGPADASTLIRFYRTGASERGGRSRDPQGRRRAIESRPTTSGVALLYRTWTGAFAKKRGGRRIVVACSYANASFTSVGSLHADAKNDTPTGKPNTNPAGTVMCG
jgi:hypothetical protein